MSCKVASCPNRPRRRGYCQTHYERMRKDGTLPVRPPSHVPPKKDVVVYQRAHERVLEAKGAARKQKCIQCPSQADHWAYDYLDPNEQTSKYGPYSCSPDHYHPMCQPCHIAHDAKQAQVA